MASNDAAPGLEGIDDLKVVAFQHERAYVIGFPVHVALTIAPEVPGSYAFLPKADMLDLGGCIGVQLQPVGHDGPTVKSVPASPFIEPDEPMGDTFTLEQGERRRMLVDLAPLIPEDLPPGDYDLTVFYVAPDSTARSEAAQVTFRAPTDADRQAVARLAPDRAADQAWSDWVTTPPPDPATLTTQVDAQSPLRFVVLLRYLLHAPTPLAQIDPAILAPLTGLYHPEGLALEAELLHARGDTAGVARLAQAIEAHFPGLQWWVRSIREGDGEIAWRRSQ